MIYEKRKPSTWWYGDELKANEKDFELFRENVDESVRKNRYYQSFFVDFPLHFSYIRKKKRKENPPEVKRVAVETQNFKQQKKLAKKEESGWDRHCHGVLRPRQHSVLRKPCKRRIVPSYSFIHKKLHEKGIKFFCNDVTCKYWPWLQSLRTHWDAAEKLLENTQPFLSIKHGQAHGLFCSVRNTNLSLYYL